MRMKRSRYRQLASSSTHPFASILASPLAAGNPAYRLPPASVLMGLLGDHTVHGRVLFPAVAYLEMARAVCSVASHFTLQGSEMRDTAFLRPLVIETDMAQVECSVTNGKLQIEDVSSGSPYSISDVKSIASRRVRLLDVQILASKCTRALHSATLYHALRLAGLEYGQQFRAVEQIWCHFSGILAALPTQSAFACLRARRSHQGTMLHPADLDGGLHIGAVLSRDNNLEGGLNVPFAVAIAVLPGLRHQSLWAAVRTEALEGQTASTTSFGATLASSAGTEFARLVGFRTRSLRAQDIRSTSLERFDMAAEKRVIARDQSSWTHVPLDHTLLQMQQVVNGAVFFQTCITAELYSLVDGHISAPDFALFPVSAHLEMANAAVRSGKPSISSASQGSRPGAHENVAAVRVTECMARLPLIIDGPASTQRVELELQFDGALVVRFGPVHADMLYDEDVCFTGCIVSAETRSTKTCPVLEPESCKSKIDMHGWSLYGSGWRVYDDVLVMGDGHGMYASFYRRQTHDSIYVHPADLHGGVVLAVCLEYGGQGSPPVPFAIDVADMYQAPRHEGLKGWAEKVQSSASVTLVMDDETPVAQLEGLRLRSVKSPFVRQAIRGKHAYETNWRALGYQSATRANDGIILLMSEAIGTAACAFPSAAPRAKHVVWVCSDHEKNVAASLQILESGLALVLEHVRGDPGNGNMWVITLSAMQATRSHKGACGLGSGLWGLSRSARTEEPLSRLCCTDVDAALGTGPTLSSFERSAKHEPETLIVSGTSLVPRLARCQGGADAHVRLPASPTHLVTGGTGALGIVTSRWLAQKCACTLMLASRSGVLAGGLAMEWELVQVCAAWCESLHTVFELFLLT